MGPRPLRGTAGKDPGRRCVRGGRTPDAQGFPTLRSAQGRTGDPKLGGDRHRVTLVRAPSLGRRPLSPEDRTKSPRPASRPPSRLEGAAGGGRGRGGGVASFRVADHRRGNTPASKRHLRGATRLNLAIGSGTSGEGVALRPSPSRRAKRSSGREATANEAEAGKSARRTAGGRSPQRRTSRSCRETPPAFFPPKRARRGPKPADAASAVSMAHSSAGERRLDGGLRRKSPPGHCLRVPRSARTGKFAGLLA